MPITQALQFVDKEIVIIKAVQSILCLKIYQNKKIIFKKLFLTSTHQNDLKT